MSVEFISKGHNFVIRSISVSFCSPNGFQAVLTNHVWAGFSGLQVLAFYYGLWTMTGGQKTMSWLRYPLSAYSLAKQKTWNIGLCQKASQSWGELQIQVIILRGFHTTSDPFFTLYSDIIHS